MSYDLDFESNKPIFFDAKLITEAYEQPEMEEVEGYDKVHQAREWMCAQQLYIRTFGARSLCFSIIAFALSLILACIKL